MTKQTVLVMGAGFTHALNTDAPLIKSDLSELFNKLKNKYTKFPSVLEIIHSISNPKQVNIEELLTRLYLGMPYDESFLSKGNKETLYEDLISNMIHSIEKIKLSDENKKILDILAKFIIEKEISCITFNYDTLFDQALWEVKKITNAIETNYFHPDGGYGFFCRPIKCLVEEGGIEGGIIKDSTSTQLFKLHGSLNWKIKKGFQKPYPLDSLIHSESWLPQTQRKKMSEEDLLTHLERSSFVVPPLLDKSVLTEQPILRVVWEKAYSLLKKSDKVIFIGYSLPMTDIASSFLFKETLKFLNRENIFVVSSPNQNSKNKDKIITRYKEVFPGMKAKQFFFTGAIDWIKKNCH